MSAALWRHPRQNMKIGLFLRRKVSFPWSNVVVHDTHRLCEGIWPPLHWFCRVLGFDKVGRALTLKGLNSSL